MRKLFIVLALLCPVAAAAQTQWDHNGSTVTRYANGANRQFNYAVPRPGLPVSSGTLLFTGRKIGDNYAGTAYAFSTRCGAVAYSVSGPVAPDQRSVTMYGRKPRRDGSCRIVDYEDDVLVFNFIDPNRTETAEVGNKTMICLRPVFIEEMRLREQIDGDRSTTLWIAQAINHLRGKYCREIGENLDYDDSVQVSETCFQYTGMFRGERVFWGQCQE